MHTLVHTRPAMGGLSEDMCASLIYPNALQARVSEMIAAWEAFCALPKSVKTQFGYMSDERFSGAGYELKENKASGFDLKENFHVRADKRAFLYGEANRIGAPEMRAFLDASMAVYEALHPLILSFAEAVEEQYAVRDLTEDVRLFLDCLIIRLLHYLPGQTPGAMLGDPHGDKGGFTGHLYESHSGVERLTRDGRWVSMNVRKGASLFFPGLGLQQRSRCALIAPCHRIVATPETARDGRVAAVCFTNIAHSRYWDKARVQRTQNQRPGFNYDMPFEEFNQLFMD